MGLFNLLGGAGVDSLQRILTVPEFVLSKAPKHKQK